MQQLRRREVLRRDPRRAWRAPAEMHVAFASADEFVASYAADIGVGGLKVATDRSALQIGEVIALQFLLPGTEQRIQTLGRVVWRHERGTPEGGETGYVGIEFLRLMDEDRAAIEEYVYDVGV